MLGSFCFIFGGIKNITYLCSMKINKLPYTHEDIISMLENSFVQSLSPLEYGKAIQTAVEQYISNKINSILEEPLLIDVSKDQELIKEFQYVNNGPGFDRLHLPSKKRVQIKLRQVDGKTPYSKQVHFENTRRHSVKNKNKSAVSGLVKYSVSEFDYVLIVLCHIVDGKRTHYTNWSYSLIESSKLEDVNNQGYCLSHIPSALLLENKYDNIYMLTNKIKNLL
jgi:hypothetical protein